MRTPTRIACKRRPSCGPTCSTGWLQTPIPIAGMQFYGTAGGGVFHETLNDRIETNVGINVGGGIKMSLAGPLRLRLDYRVFTLQGTPRTRSRSGSMPGLT